MCGHITQETLSFKCVTWQPHLDSLEDVPSRSIRTTGRLKGLAVDCNAFCLLVTCAAWLKALNRSCLMAIRWSVHNYSVSFPLDRLPVEPWTWWRGQGLKEKVLIALCGWCFYKQKKALIWRSVCCSFPCCEKEDTFCSLELIMDFTFYKHMIKLVMHAEKKIYGQVFKL